MQITQTTQILRLAYLILREICMHRCIYHSFEGLMMIDDLLAHCREGRLVVAVRGCGLGSWYGFLAS